MTDTTETTHAASALAGPIASAKEMTAWAVSSLWAWLVAAIQKSPQIAAVALLAFGAAVYFDKASLPWVKPGPDLIAQTQIEGLDSRIQAIEAALPSYATRAELQARAASSVVTTGGLPAKKK